MICLLRGTVRQIGGSDVTLDVNGVGYLLHCTRGLLAELEVGGEREILVHTEVREDAIRLYAFRSQLERETFQLLIRVSGIGAKTAAEILSQVECNDLLRSIASQDVQKLQSFRGIGKKTAERLVVELKDIVSQHVESSQTIAARIEREGSSLPEEEAVAALIALGIPQKQALQAVARVPEQDRRSGQQAGEIVREALRYI